MRRAAAALYRHPKVQLTGLLAAPVGWLVIAYLGSLALFLLSSFWQVDAFTGNVITQPTLENYQTILSQPIYRTIAVRTIGMAALVTLTTIVIAFPIAYYMARVASPRTRGLMVVRPSGCASLWSAISSKPLRQG